MGGNAYNCDGCGKFFNGIPHLYFAEGVSEGLMYNRNEDFCKDCEKAIKQFIKERYTQLTKRGKRLDG